MFDFRTKTVFCGDSQKEFNKIKTILDSNSIRYKSQTADHEQNTFLPGRGTARSFGGSFGKTAPVYEILVSEKDFDTAQYLLRQNQL